MEKHLVKYLMLSGHKLGLDIHKVRREILRNTEKRTINWIKGRCNSKRVKKKRVINSITVIEYILPS